MDCSICLNETGFTEQGRKPKACNDVRLKCTHTFHRTCIKKWYLQSDACPVCRREMKFREGSYFKYMMLVFELRRYFYEACNSIYDDDIYIYYDNASMILFIHNMKQNQLHFSMSMFHSRYIIEFKGLLHLY